MAKKSKFKKAVRETSIPKKDKPKKEYVVTHKAAPLKPKENLKVSNTVSSPKPKPKPKKDK